MKFTLKDLAKKVIIEEKRPLTALEIWKFAQKNGYDKAYGFVGKDAWNTLSRKVKNEIADDENTDFLIIEARPVKFYLKTFGSDKEVEKVVKNEIGKIEEQELNLIFDEEDLYPLLAYFCDTMGIHPKTIKHQKSKKSHAQWLHPDLVGVYYPIKRWKKEVVDFSKTLSAVGIKIFSFEVKKSLGFANLRESFFQAVSNSSWANEGYLVAVEINQDEDFISELKRLSNAFGIGIIKLDTSNPDLSVIFLPSKIKDNLDWETINKLVNYNSDFLDFIVSINENSGVTKINKGLYDSILDAELLKHKFQNLSRKNRRLKKFQTKYSY